MKKLLLSVIAFALITTSCNKYKDDFKNLNARLDALAAQITGVSTLVAGIQASQVTLAQITAALNTATGPLAAQLTALTTTVNGISTTLATVAAGTQSNTAALATLTTLVTNNQTAALAAIAALQTSLTNGIANINANTNTQIAAAQAALAAAITAAQNNINASTAAAVTAATNTLNASITAAIASINGNTDAQVTAAINALNASILAAQLNINANTAAEVAAAQAALAALIGANNAAIVALSGQLTAATTLLDAAITAAQNAIVANDNSNHAIIKAIVDALTIQLAIANAQIQTLLSSNNVFVGDINIFDEASLAFAESLGAKVRVVTGDVTINTSGLSNVDPDGAGPLLSQMARLNTVTDGATLAGTPPPDRIFIGSINGNLTVSGNKAVDLGSLVNVGGTTGNVSLTGANHDLSALLSVVGTYTVTVSDFIDNALLSVGGNMTLNYPAAYSYPSLTTIGGTLTTTDGAFVTSISFPVLSSVGAIDGNTPVWAWATSVNLGAGNLTSLTANAASTIILGEPTYPGTFTLTGNLATTLTMSAATSVAGALNISIGSAVGGVNPVTTVNLSNLTATTGTITISTDASTNSTVSLTNYNDNDNIVINGPTVQTLPAYTGISAPSLISSGSIQTLTLAVYRAVQSLGAQFDGLTALRNLTLGAARGVINTASFAGDAAALLQTLTVTYASFATAYQQWVDLNTMANLTTVSVTSNGELNGTYLSNNPLLTSVTTAGQQDWFYVLNNDAVGLTLNMGNTAVTSANGLGSWTIVDGNQNLTSFTSSTSYMRMLDVSDNPNLTSVNFSSFVAGQNITAGTVDVYVAENGLSGTYTASIFATNSAPVIVQAGLSTLKAYMNNLYGSMAHTVNMQLGFGTGVAPAVDNSIALLDADRAAFILAGGTAANTFVQRTGDSGGDVGSHINVQREMNYIQ